MFHIDNAAERPCYLSYSGMRNLPPIGITKFCSQNDKLFVIDTILNFRMHKCAPLGREICIKLIMLIPGVSGRDYTKRLFKEIRIASCRTVVRGNKGAIGGKSIHRVDRLRFSQPWRAITLVGAIVVQSPLWTLVV